MLLPRVTKLTICVLLIGAVNLFPAAALAQSSLPFVNREFVIPQQLETDEFRLRMLTVNDVVKDYDAVMSSAEYLKAIWPGSKWPDGLTLEQNLIDLGWHQKEFQRRRSFAYTVVTLNETRVIGCVYIDPTRKRGYDAEVYLWAREAALGSPADTRLFEAVNEWLATEWPFEKVSFPGRTIDWDSWMAIPDEQR
jgi:hypothetical protein